MRRWWTLSNQFLKDFNTHSYFTTWLWGCASVCTCTWQRCIDRSIWYNLIGFLMFWSSLGKMKPALRLFRGVFQEERLMLLGVGKEVEYGWSTMIQHRWAGESNNLEFLNRWTIGMEATKTTPEILIHAGIRRWVGTSYRTAASG